MVLTHQRKAIFKLEMRRQRRKKLCFETCRPTIKADFPQPKIKGKIDIVGFMDSWEKDLGT